MVRSGYHTPKKKKKKKRKEKKRREKKVKLRRKDPQTEAQRFNVRNVKSALRMMLVGLKLVRITRGAIV
jgi:hypothetical protein